MALKESSKQFSLPAEGIVPARLARIIEIGEHLTDYGVKDQLYLYYSLPTRLIEDEGDFLGKQHMVRSRPMKNSDSVKAALWDHRKVLNPETRNLSDLLDIAAFLTLTHNTVEKDGQKRTFCNITNISGVPEGMEVGALDTTKFYFDFDNPDADIWTKLGDFTREKIQSALNYNGSEVEKMVLHLEAMAGDAED